MYKKKINNKTIYIYENINEAPSNIIATYQRKTTLKDENSKFSLEAQRNESEHICSKLNFFHIKHYTESEAVSAETFDRPKLTELLSDITSGKISIIMVRDLDRLYRSPEILAAIKKQLVKYKIKLYTFDGEVDYKSPEGEFRTNILAATGKFETAMTSSRIKRNKKTNAEKGYSPYGIAPYGYTSQSMLKKELMSNGYDEDQANIESVSQIPNKKIYKINTKEELLIKLIFNAASNEDPQKRMGSRKIATMLNNSNYKTRTGSKWRANKITQIINNPFYAGYTYYDEDALKNFSNKKSGKHLQKRYDGKHEAIISKEQWHKVRRYRENNKKNCKTTKKTKHFYGLANIIKCKCGKNYVGKTCNQKSKYYLCKDKKDFGIDTCNSPNFKKDATETVILKSIKRIFNTPSIIKRIFHKIEELQKSKVIVNDYTKDITRLKEIKKRYLYKFENTENKNVQNIAWEKIVEFNNKIKLLESIQSSESSKINKRKLNLNDIKKKINSLIQYINKKELRSHELFELLNDQHEFKINVIDKKTLQLNLSLMIPHTKKVNEVYVPGVTNTWTSN